MKMNCTVSIFGCTLLSLTYILSLYVWNTNTHRDDPSTVKKRFLSVFVMSIISPAFVINFSYCSSGKHTIWELLGLRINGLLLASTVPLILTMILFLGPIVIQKKSYNTWTLYSDPSYWLSNLKNPIWLRDHLVAPLSEELTFRACMLPLLIQCFRPHNAVFICPLFFGIAHSHHIFDLFKSGLDLKSALFVTAFQVLYTTLFGAYSTFLFLRTGHFIAPFLVHAFCNYMGVPDFSVVITYKEPRRILTVAICVFGLVCWCLLLSPLTNPVWYQNNIYI